MGYNDFGEEAQDRRPAANYVGFLSRGYYTEEMLVHDEEGILLGKLIASSGAGKHAVTFASLEETRPEYIARMRNGF